MATKKLTLKPLSTTAQQRAAELRAAHARGENTARITAKAMSRQELAASLRRSA